MIGETRVALNVKIDIAAIAQGACEFVREVVLIAGTRRGHHVVVPFVGLHREQDVEAGVGEKPSFILDFRFWILDFRKRSRSRLMISNSGETNSGVADDAAAWLE